MNDRKLTTWRSSAQLGRDQVHAARVSTVRRRSVWALALIVAAAAAGHVYAARSSSPGQEATSSVSVRPPPAAPDWTAKPTVMGYFDHTADWYRRSKRFREDQTVAHSWGKRDLRITVVLYNDIRATKSEQGSDTGTVDDIRMRIAERAADIGNYLDAAGGSGNIRVLLQLPAEVVRRWPSKPNAMRTLMRDFIAQWRDRPALAGFYLYDEAELSDIPTATLQELTSLIKKEARPGGNTAAFSVASSAIAEKKPLLDAYASASPPAFDVLLVNRYPVYRDYGAAGKQGDTTFGVEKLGFEQDKARRENLRDNEFANLGGYYDSLVAATRIARLEGRPVYAAVQAYGLRDDCDGVECKVVGERNPRRSPTWRELLNMFTSAWMSGLDGAILYSHYFSLYDSALRKRVSNLEKLMPDVFRYLPVRGPGIALRSVSNDAAGAAQRPENTYARYVPDPYGRKYYYLVVLQNRHGRKAVKVLFNPQLRITKVRERRFDQHGNPLEAVAQSFDKNADGVAREMQLTLESYGVRIFELHYD